MSDSSVHARRRSVRFRGADQDQGLGSREGREAPAAAARECTLLLAVGSTLSVHPAAGLCEAAVRAGAYLIVVSAEPTPYDDLAEEVVRLPIAEALPAMVADAL